MAREPHDVFIKEFFQHPAWENVLVELERLAWQLQQETIGGTKDEFEGRKGKCMGVYEAMSLLRGLIKSYNEKG